MAESATVGVLRVLLTADASGFGSELDKAGTKATGWGSTLSGSVLPIVQNVGLALAGLGTAFMGLATEAAESGDKIAKSAREAGLSAQSYQEIFFAVGQIAKITDEQLTKAFGRLTTTIGEAENGSKRAQTALQELGLPLDKIRSGSITTEEAFNAFLKKVQEAPTATEAARIAADTFGDRAGPKLAGALREGGTQVDVLRQQFRELGLGMSGEALAAAEKWKDQTDTLSRQFSALGRSIGEAVLPLLTETLIPFIQSHAIPAMKAFVEIVAGAIKMFQGLPEPVKLIAGAIAGLIGFVGTLTLMFDAIALVVAPLLPLFGTTLPAVLTFIGTTIAGLVTGPFALFAAAVAGLVIVWIKWGDDIKRITVEAFEAVKGFFASAIQTITGLWTTLKTNVVTTVSEMMQSVRQWLVTFWEGSIFQSVARMLQAMVELWVALRTRVIVEAAQLMTSVYKWLVEQLAPIVDGVKSFLTILADGWRAFKDAVIARVTEIATGVKSWLQDKLQPVFTAIQSFFAPVLTLWTAAKDKVIDLVTALYTGVKTWLVDKFVDIVNGIKAKIDAVTGFFKSMKDAVVGNSYVPEMVDLIGVHISRLDGLMVQPVLKYTDGVSDLFAGMKTESLGLMGELINGVGKQTDRYPTVLTNPTQQASSLTQTIFGAMSQGVQGIVGNLFNRVQGNTVSFGSSFTGTIGGISQGTQGIFNALSQGVQQIVGNMFNSLLGQAQSWGGMFMGILNNIIGAGISALVSWGLGQLGRLIGGWIGGGEEGTQVNPARDQFLSQFGGSGTGPGSGFWELGARLEGAVGSAQAEALHAALRQADTMAAFNAAVAAINAALGGGGGGFGTQGMENMPSGGFTGSLGGTGVMETVPSWVGMEAPEEDMGVLERMARGMAEGGFGRVDRPTLFLAGEAGPEDFAFSGANKSFGGGPSVTVNLNGTFLGEEDWIKSAVIDGVNEAWRANTNSAFTRSRAALGLT